MLLYSLLHLTGVKAVSKDYETLGEPSVPLEAIKRFRQLGSRCPGHPEYRWTSGIETTTGPLGQGVTNSVGMAIAGRWMAAHFNRPGFDEATNFNVYALCGDGCMLVGISHEAASAGRRMRSSISPTVSMSTSGKGSVLAGSRCVTRGSRASKSTRASTRSWPISCTGCSTGSCRMDGTRTCRHSRLTPRVWPHGSPP